MGVFDRLSDSRLCCEVHYHPRSMATQHLSQGALPDVDRVEGEALTLPGPIEIGFPPRRKVIQRDHLEPMVRRRSHTGSR
jgi:hypothetical protein